MSETAASPSAVPHVRRTLAGAAAELRSTTTRAALFQVGWRWLAVVGSLFILDLVFGLPVWLRWAGLVGQLGAVGWWIRAWMRSVERRGRGPEWAARAIESDHPELDNALINAVQFERALQTAPEPQAVLMRRELSRAEQAATSLSSAGAVNRGAERQAARMLLVMGGVWVAVGLLFPGGFLAVVPRLLMPWLDDVTPPFSLTRYDLRPAGATVRSGESLGVAVDVTGPIPSTVALMTRTGNTGWRRVALDSLEPGRYTVTLTDLREDTWFFAQGDNGRSARYQIKVQTPPRALSLRAAYSYPRYTKKEKVVERLGDEGIHGLIGTRVNLEVVANRGLGAGELELKLEDGTLHRVVLQVEPSNRTRGSAQFTLTRSGAFRLSLVAEDGQTTTDAAHGPVKVERDQRPTVWFPHPGADLIVTEDMAVPLLVEAEDDLGLDRVVIHRIINDLGDSPREYPQAAPVQHSAHELRISMPELGVRAGDTIQYFGTAFDNDPGTPNVGESEVFEIRVVTPEEYREALERRTKEEAAQRPSELAGAVRDLAERQQAVAAKLDEARRKLEKNPADAAAQKAMKAAKEAQAALSEEARSVAKAMQEYAESPATSELERALKAAMGKMAEQMVTADGSMQRASGQASPRDAAQAAQEAARQLQALQRRMERQVEKSLENLEKIWPLYNDMDRFMALVDAQGQLLLRAREFEAKSSPTPADRARLAELEAQQNRIREELTRLQQDLRAHADGAEQSFPKAAATARKIAEEIDRRRIAPTMAEGQDRLRRPDAPAAFERMQEALRQMEAMVSQCQAGKSQCEGDLDISLSRSLGRSGLGRSLGSFGRGSQAQGGVGNGMAGTGSTRTSRAYMPGAARLGGSGGHRRDRKQNRIAGAPADLSPADVESMKNPARRQQRAADSDPNRYPPEYRKLISDYFKSVAERQ